TVPVSSCPDPASGDLTLGVSTDALRGAFSERTRLVLVNTPHNPTGLMLGQDALAAIVDKAVRDDALLATDEVYDDLTFGTPHRLAPLGRPSLLGARLDDRLEHRSTGAARGGHGAQAVADVLLRRTVPARGGGGARHAAGGLRGAGRRSEGTPRPAHRRAARD